MKDVTELSISKKSIMRSISAYSNTNDFILKDEAIDKLISEGGLDFYNYFRSEDNSFGSNLIVLSAHHHYYYDTEELKKVKSVIFLKKLNRVKEIDSFLKSHLNFLPDQCNVFGCFVNNIKINRYALRIGRTRTDESNISDSIQLGIVSRFPFLNMLYSYMDSKTNSYMSEAVVTLLLKVHGFKVINMTESNGLTYFHATKFVSLLNVN
jgi:hypothetical protein